MLDRISRCARCTKGGNRFAQNMSDADAESAPSSRGSRSTRALVKPPAGSNPGYGRLGGGRSCLCRRGLIWSWTRRIRKLLAATWPMSSGFGIALLKATPSRSKQCARNSLLRIQNEAAILMQRAAHFAGTFQKKVCAYAQNLLARFANPCDVPFRSSRNHRSPRRRTYKQ